MVARLVWDQDAGGSSPLTSTKKTYRKEYLYVFFTLEEDLKDQAKVKNGQWLDSFVLNMIR